MGSPIAAHVPAVFIHVKDMKRAIDFYGKLLGEPYRPENDYRNGIYRFDLKSGLHLLLDANGSEHQRPGDGPVCMFDTVDIDAAYEHMKRNGIEPVTEVQRFPNVSWFNFKDPDGNLHMICYSVERKKA